MFKIFENNFNLNENKKENEILKENIKQIENKEIEINLLNILIKFYELHYIIEIENKYNSNKYLIKIKEKNYYKKLKNKEYTKIKMLMLLFYDLNNYEIETIKEIIKNFNKQIKYNNKIKL